MKSQQDSHSGTLAEAKAEIERLQERLQAEQRETKAQTTKLEAERKTLQAKLADTEGELTTLRGKMQEAQQAVAQTRSEAERSEDEAVDSVHAFYESLTGLDARLTERGLMVNLTDKGLRFPSGSATLPDDALPVLDEVAAVLKQRPQLSATIQGHTDSSGNAELNQRLSAQRASAVRDALVERGVDGARMTTEGVGSADPIADNATAAGRERNRRVELYLKRPQSD